MTDAASPTAAVPESSDAQELSDTPEQLRIRRAKRDRLLEQGQEAYPVSVDRTHSLLEIREQFPSLDADTATGELVGVAGRVIFVRNTGKLCFATLQEGDGTQLQAMISLAGVGEDALAAWKSDVDLGDFVFVHGEVISSRRGELSVMADKWQIASKALRPLPVAHKELNEETRIRQRYLDLITRPEAREVARKRIAVVRELRTALERRGFLEVETPMLQTLHGGAAARPFVTHSNALDADLYLRIAPELFLKRCVVGGIEKVFEINRNFRNEGADSSHSPEFAMLETYEAYGTYDDSARMTRELIQEVAQAALGTQIVLLPDGTTYDLSGEWTTLEMYPSLSESIGVTVTPDTTVDELLALAEKVGLEVPRKDGKPIYGHGKLVEELWEHQVGDGLSAPTFVRDFPVETSPLTRQHRSKPGVTEKWDLYVRGFELATGYSELVDPVIQRERFEDQARQAAAGDDEAMVLDEDFLAAMEQGMPPTTGTGMGIDRLLMALTGLGIRETILFPIVKPQG
ncbi:lysine--tRNA ligase [Rhodococcus sp. RS1C4]|uniref:lysine--tRNA ligase n=1 Tax=Nocardiaceae TaxID=85025 RepID=UPI00037A6996|nr:MULTISPECIES: lysine--tRNA ligase [Rhodococcus]OZC53065.1 lysine--tRNA ligase [Rhodococcus sp. RS1C4]OZD15014.1 lysine--tRNA ligase [Rhodococcus sp. 06-156-4C]OZD19901.1 lysine--tRNA ligase [Rhodococcus sp. 06-156-4a]OZD22790.1 lysine--tRNA ligase [Rhodococcus sp. 06-156-3C]OZD25919.1 lysine--tRNA ligase [Rhodococcus sp. 06-156-3b]